MMSALLELRIRRPDDDDAVRALCTAVRAHEFSALPAAARDQILELQYRAQSHHYGQAHPDAIDELIVDGDEVVGRMLWSEHPATVRLIDLAVTPTRQGQGLGGAALDDLIRRSGSRRIELTVLVENAGARRLYERLGFVADEAAGAHLHMHRDSQAQA